MPSPRTVRPKRIGASAISTMPRHGSLISWAAGLRNPLTRMMRPSSPSTPDSISGKAPGPSLRAVPSSSSCVPSANSAAIAMNSNPAETSLVLAFIATPIACLRRRPMPPPETAASVGVFAGLLDHRLPAVDLAQHLLLKRGGRGLVGRHRRGAKLGEALDHFRVRERGLQGFRQLGDDRLRRSGRRIEPVPDAEAEALEAAFLDG